MFFAVFEKKWWKSGSADESKKSKQENPTESKKSVESDVVDDEISEINDAVSHTSTNDWEKSERKLEVQDESDEEDFDEDVFTNSDNFEQVDPHAPAPFNLDEDNFQEEPVDRRRPQKSRVGSVKEFFTTEILYRYDILNDADRNAIKGDYLIELTGETSGFWNVNLDRDITITQPENKPNNNALVTLKFDSEDFISIVNGKINSQIALVSKRVKITGDSRKASLLQNIIAPITE